MQSRYTFCKIQAVYLKDWAYFWKYCVVSWTRKSVNGPWNDHAVLPHKLKNVMQSRYTFCKIQAVYLKDWAYFWKYCVVSWTRKSVNGPWNDHAVLPHKLNWWCQNVILKIQAVYLKHGAYFWKYFVVSWRKSVNGPWNDHAVPPHKLNWWCQNVILMRLLCCFLLIYFVIRCLYP